MLMVWHLFVRAFCGKCGAKLQIIFSVCKTLRGKMWVKKFDFQQKRWRLHGVGHEIARFLLEQYHGIGGYSFATPGVTQLFGGGGFD